MPSPISRFTSRRPILPLCGSTLPKAIIMSLLALAASSTSSFGMRRRPISNSVVDREHHEADLLLAVEVDGLEDGRRRARLEVFLLRLLDVVGVIVLRLAAGNFRVRVHVDGDQICCFHGWGFCHNLRTSRSGSSRFQLNCIDTLLDEQGNCLSVNGNELLCSQPGALVREAPVGKAPPLLLAASSPAQRWNPAGSGTPAQEPGS